MSLETQLENLFQLNILLKEIYQVFPLINCERNKTNWSFLRGKDKTIKSLILHK